MSMELYHKLYAACLIGAVICVGAALVLYIRLDIRTAWSVLARGRRTGYPKEESVSGEKGLVDSEYLEETEVEEGTRTVILPRNREWEKG